MIPRLILGPMEGVLDALMRQILTEINPYDLCVTEFVRVVDATLPPRVFYKVSPELFHHGKTSSGTPVRVQLLGQSPEYMASNAALVSELGSSGVDINFGCPSKTVNGSKGGAALLKDPELMYDIVKAVRTAVPSDQVVSAKVRLGYIDCSAYQEIVDAVVMAGANEIVVHGRSKLDGYKAETIRWDLIGKIKQSTKISVIANGEIWHQSDAQNCTAMTGCHDLMVCRGALNMPNLGAHIKNGQSPMEWKAVVALLIRYSALEIEGDKGLYYPNRVKQWLRYLQGQYPEAKDLFVQIRQYQHKDPILDVIFRTLDSLENQTVGEWV